MTTTLDDLAVDQPAIASSGPRDAASELAITQILSCALGAQTLEIVSQALAVSEAVVLVPARSSREATAVAEHLRRRGLHAAVVIREN